MRLIVTGTAVLFLFGIPAAPQSGPSGADLTSSTKLLGDKDRDKRIRAARSLGEMGAPAVSTLTGLLNDKRQDVRVYAAVALAEMAASDPANARAALSVLVSALESGFSKKDWETKVDVAVALGKLGPDAKPAEAALEKAVSRAGQEFLDTIRNAGGTLTMSGNKGWDRDLPPYPMILSRFNSDGSKALKRIRGEGDDKPADKKP